MRTTITLDPDADALVKKAMRERGQTFKQVVNAAIVTALAVPTRPTIELPAYPMGPARVDLTKALQLSGELEDDDILRKMSMGK